VSSAFTGLISTKQRNKQHAITIDDEAA